nr:hypothetical protein [Clostridium perfringens]
MLFINYIKLGGLKMSREDIINIMNKALDAGLKNRTIAIVTLLLTYGAFEVSVTQVEMARRLNMDRTFLIKGIRELENKNFITVKKEGKRNIYIINK